MRLNQEFVRNKKNYKIVGKEFRDGILVRLLNRILYVEENKWIGIENKIKTKYRWSVVKPK